MLRRFGGDLSAQKAIRRRFARALRIQRRVERLAGAPVRELAGEGKAVWTPPLP
ncbi:hypothetical protein MASR2M79_14890 [Aminivibrio sp.]